MTPDDRQRNSALTFGLCFFVGCIIVWAAMCAPGRLLAEAGPYAPGDTCRVYVVAFDSTGIELLPTSAKVYIDYLDSRLDSLYYPSGGLTQVGEQNWLKGDYVVPSTWTHPYTLTFSAIFTGDGFTDDLAATIPTLARVNARVKTVDEVTYTALLDSARVVSSLTEEVTASISRVDTLGTYALTQFWESSASSTVAVLDSSSCTPCGIYSSGGTPVTGAVVYVTRGPTYNAQTDLVNWGLSLGGDYKIAVPLLPGVPDTFYVRAYQQGGYDPNGAMVVIP